MQSSKKRTK
jgi:serine/threonine protein kinase